jgi:very-short-patch-repair endonuclease
VVEIDGDRFHRALVDQRRDAARHAALERAGWLVLRFEEHDVWHAPARVVCAVRSARSDRTRGTPT